MPEKCRTSVADASGFSNYSSAPLSRKNLPENPTADDILNAFLDYLTNTDTEPYDH